MRKNYNVSLSDGGYSLTSKVNKTLTDVDSRLDRLERLFRAHVLEPAEVPVGSPMTVACDKVEKAAKQVRALADKLVRPVPKPKSGFTMATTKAGLRGQIEALRDCCASAEDDNYTLAQQVSKLSSELNAALKLRKVAEGRLADKERELHKVSEQVRQLAASLYGK